MNRPLFVNDLFLSFEHVNQSTNSTHPKRFITSETTINLQPTLNLIEIDIINLVNSFESNRITFKGVKIGFNG